MTPWFLAEDFFLLYLGSSLIVVAWFPFLSYCSFDGIPLLLGLWFPFYVFPTNVKYQNIDANNIHLFMMTFEVQKFKWLSYLVGSPCLLRLASWLSLLQVGSPYFLEAVLSPPWHNQNGKQTHWIDRQGRIILKCACTTKILATYIGEAPSQNKT